MTQDNSKKEPTHANETVSLLSSLLNEAIMARENKQGFSMVLNWLIDELAPNLTGTQLRIMLVVIRLTCGWGKEKDTITQTFLAKKTGVWRTSISDNIRPLIESGILIVANNKYGVLDSPAKRRKSGLARIETTYQLHPALVVKSDKQKNEQQVKNNKQLSVNTNSDRREKRHNQINEINKKDSASKRNAAPPSKELRCENCNTSIHDPMQYAWSRWRRKKFLCETCFPRKGGAVYE